MNTLAEFLSARIAEDEAVAKAATSAGDADAVGHWRFIEFPHEGTWPIPSMVGTLGGRESDVPWAVHAERHDPARVLAECEAKRLILDRCRPIDRTLLADVPASAIAAWDVVDTLNQATLRDLALPYADHPDYRSEWAVS